MGDLDQCALFPAHLEEEKDDRIPAPNGQGQGSNPKPHGSQSDSLTTEPLTGTP